MAYLVKADGNEWLAGLVWEHLSEVTAKARDIAAVLKRSEALRYIAIKESDPVAEDAVGVLPKGKYKNEPKTPSLAAAVLHQVDNECHVLMPVEKADGEAAWWYLAVADGLPVAGSDRLVEVSEIAETLEGDATFSEDPIKVYAPEEVSAQLPGVEVVPTSWPQLLPTGARGVGKLKKPKGNPVVAVGVFVAIIAVGGAITFALWPEQSGVNRAAQNAAAQRLRDERRAEDLIVEFRDQVLQTNGDTWVKASKAVLYGLPINSDGLKMVKFKCEWDYICTVTYKSTPVMNVTSFRSRYAPIAEKIVFPVDGSGARMMIDLTGKARSLNPYDLESGSSHAAAAVADFVREAPESKQFAEELLIRLNAMNRVQPTGWSRKVSEPTANGDIGSNSVAKDMVGGVPYTGEIAFSLEEIWLLDHILELIESKYIAVKEFSVSGIDSGAPTIGLKGNYLVKGPFPE